jgi:hypothetical protein
MSLIHKWWVQGSPRWVGSISEQCVVCKNKTDKFLTVIGFQNLIHDNDLITGIWCMLKTIMSTYFFREHNQTSHILCLSRCKHIYQMTKQTLIMFLTFHWLHKITWYIDNVREKNTFILSINLKHDNSILSCNKICMFLRRSK